MSKEQKKLLSELLDKANKVQQQILSPVFSKLLKHIFMWNKRPNYCSALV